MRQSDGKNSRNDKASPQLKRRRLLERILPQVNITPAVMQNDIPLGNRRYTRKS